MVLTKSSPPRNQCMIKSNIIRERISTRTTSKTSDRSNIITRNYSVPDSLCLSLPVSLCFVSVVSMIYLLEVVVSPGVYWVWCGVVGTVDEWGDTYLNSDLFSSND